MDGDRIIRPERYQGYLDAWTSDIVRLYAAGISRSEIAKRLTPAVRKTLAPRYGGDTLEVSSTMILYVLRRIGMISYDEPLNAKQRDADAARRNRQRAKLQSWQTRDAYTALASANDNWNNAGRPLDMGGPRDQWLEQSPWDER